MKKIILSFLTASVVVISCNNNAATKTSKDSTASASQASANAAMDFKKNNFDFGKINQGDKVTHEFEFTNNGKEPLIISSATATCGCTVPEYPKEPVAPGKSGIIKVIFNSAGKSGMQHKVVTVTANTEPAATELYLTGEVTGEQVKKVEQEKK